MNNLFSGILKARNFTFKYTQYHFDTLEYEQVLVSNRVSERQIEEVVYHVCEAGGFFKTQQVEDIFKTILFILTAFFCIGNLAQG